MAADSSPVSGIAGRYASALYDLAQQEKAIDQVQADLDRLDRMISENPELGRLVRSPVFTSEEQSRAVGAVLDKAEIFGLAGNFVRLVASNRRLFALHEMVSAFRTLVARGRGETTAQVTVAEPLSDKHLSSITDTLKQVTGKDVALDVKVDPSIIGGLVVKLGSRMIDASLRTKLNAIRFAMKEAR